MYRIPVSSLILRGSLTGVLLLMIFLLSSCGAGGSKSDPPISQYQASISSDTPIKALDYLSSESVGITLYVSSSPSGSEKRKFSKLSDGDFVPTGVPVQLGILVDPSREWQDAPWEYRIFLSDGSGDFQVEAYPDPNSEYYVCEYIFDNKYYSYPLLVTVLYPDMIAAKKKMIFSLHKEMRARPGDLVEKGLGIVLSKEIMDGLTEQMSSLLPESLPAGIEVTDFKPATSGEDVFHINLGNFLGADMNLFDTYVDDDDKEVRGLRADMKLTGGESANLMNNITELFLSLVGPMIASTGLTSMIMGPMSIDLDEQLSGMFGESGGEESMISAILEDLKLDRVIFLNVVGLPGETSEDFAAIRTGLYADDKNGLDINFEDKYMWPEVKVDDTNTQINLSSLKSGKTDIGIALSQYNLNQVTGEMLRGVEIKLSGDIITPITKMIPLDNPSNILTASISFNPYGILMKLGVPENKITCMAYGVSMEVLENNVSVSCLSIDLGLHISPGIRVENGELFLDLVVSYVPELSHASVLKDSKGLTIIDKSDISSYLWDMITGSEGDFVQSISLTNMGLIPKAGESPGSIEFDDNGNCYMSLALESLDAGSSGLCFISAAGAVSH